MASVEIIVDLEAERSSHKYKHLDEGVITVIGAMPRGMQSGKPSVGIIVETSDGRAIYAETSLSLYLAAGDALKAAHGDPRKDEDPQGGSA